MTRFTVVVGSGYADKFRNLIKNFATINSTSVSITDEDEIVALPKKKGGDGEHAQ